MTASTLGVAGRAPNGDRRNDADRNKNHLGMSARAIAVRLEEEHHTLQTGWDTCHATVIDVFGPRLSSSDRTLDRVAGVSAALRDLRILLLPGSGYV
jgi:hypothetical protein